MTEISFKRRNKAPEVFIEAIDLQGVIERAIYMTSDGAFSRSGVFVASSPLDRDQ
jgi:hypothetical protein